MKTTPFYLQLLKYGKTFLKNRKIKKNLKKNFKIMEIGCNEGFF